jgi:hypothetical protein
MREMDRAGYGMADDGLFLDVAEAAQRDDADDEAFERWLASLSPGGLEHILNELLDGHASVPFDQTA